MIHLSHILVREPRVFVGKFIVKMEYLRKNTGIDSIEGKMYHKKKLKKRLFIFLIVLILSAILSYIFFEIGFKEPSNNKQPINITLTSCGNGICEGAEPGLCPEDCETIPSISAAIG